MHGQPHIRFTYKLVILLWSLRSTEEYKSRVGMLDTGFRCSYRRTDMKNMVTGTPTPHPQKILAVIILEKHLLTQIVKKFAFGTHTHTQSFVIVFKRPFKFSILRQIQLTLCSTIHFNIILTLTPRSSNCNDSFKIPHQIPLCIILLSQSRLYFLLHLSY